MKKINIFAVTVFVTLFGLAGCNNIFQPAKVQENPEAGKGYVRLQFGSAAARTLLPIEYEFAAYKFTFTPTGTDNGRTVTIFNERADNDTY